MNSPKKYGSTEAIAILAAFLALVLGLVVHVWQKWHGHETLIILERYILKVESIKIKIPTYSY